MSDPTMELEVLKAVLDQMKIDKPGPKPLARLVNRVVEDDYPDADGSAVAAELLARIRSEDPNDLVRVLFLERLHRWDGNPGADWRPKGAETAPRTVARRGEVYGRLKLDEATSSYLDENHPVRSSTEGKPIDLKGPNLPDEWYDGEEGFYFSAYRERLRRAKWPEEGIDGLTSISRQILQRLDDPRRSTSKARAVRGLVVGYVQSGKTANFIGLIARAIDAGYRLIIILAGNTNILRQQTQRRLDKELVGRAGLPVGYADYYDYTADEDWEEFQNYDPLPEKLGAPVVQRLTGFEGEYPAPRVGLEYLEFGGSLAEPMRPFNDVANLKSAPTRLIVMKKHHRVLGRLSDDLDLLRKTKLSDVPTLIIDDESDQGGINTHRSLSRTEAAERTATNEQLVRLLSSLPRAQYVGYTATPFANAFVDPEDPEDIYPRHFMLCLGRPSAYMGVKDFYDLDDDGQVLAEDDLPEGFASNKKAYYRRVAGATDTELQEAIDAWVLAGAIKVYRERHVADLEFRHHTMLVHTDTKKVDHKFMAKAIRRLWKASDYQSGNGLTRLEGLWDSDYKPVAAARWDSEEQHRPGPDRAALIPASFQELEECIGECLGRIDRNSGGNKVHPALVVNSDRDFQHHRLDFHKTPVWRILVGGTKLSRGFTIEGLTISYYRRATRNADTLMQMGRWFGFRRGYRDLVRLYLGVETVGSGRNARLVDLYDEFGAVCLDEEHFRGQLAAYAGERDEAGDELLTPLQMPAFVSSHSDFLRPAARNKMQKVELLQENFGGRWVEKTLLPTLRNKKETQAGKDNLSRFSRVFEPLKWTTLAWDTRFEDRVVQTASGATRTSAGRASKGTALVALLTPAKMEKLLASIRWRDGAKPLARLLRFLKGRTGAERGIGDPSVDRWLVIAPQVNSRQTRKTWTVGKLEMRCVARDRVSDPPRFKAFSEPRHRQVAEYLAGLRDCDSPGDQLQQQRVPNLGVMLFYPSVQVYRHPDGTTSEDKVISVGHALLCPSNGIQRRLVFGHHGDQ